VAAISWHSPFIGNNLLESKPTQQRPSGRGLLCATQTRQIRHVNLQHKRNGPQAAVLGNKFVYAVSQGHGFSGCAIAASMAASIMASSSVPLFSKAQFFTAHDRSQGGK
jgi:hypothetical protein